MAQSPSPPRPRAPRTDTTRKGVGDFYLATNGDIHLAISGDLPLAINGDFHLATDKGAAISRIPVSKVT